MQSLRAGAVRPAYYVASGGLEPIHVIRAWSLGFELGNAVKYLLRAGRKGHAHGDLLKAQTYVQFVAEQVAAERPLLEWSCDQPRRLSPLAVGVAFELDEPRLMALSAIYDVACRPHFARDFLSTAQRAIAAAIAATAQAPAADPVDAAEATRVGDVTARIAEAVQ